MRLLLSAVIILSLAFFSPIAIGSEEQVYIEVYPDILINENFYGFGAETLPWLWSKENRRAGLNEDDIMLNLKRIKDMRLPITRIFVPWETWNPSADYKSFTWESDEMASLYKTLDLYQDMGTQVILVTVDWLRDSPWKNTERSAEAALKLLDYLIRDKGYTCIKFWTLTNEPELTYGWLGSLTFEDYVEIHKLVKKGIKEKGLPVKIIASDEVESPEWFEKSVHSLGEIADVFSSHVYLYPRDMALAKGFFKERLDAIKEIDENATFFLTEFGFRGGDFGVRHNSFMQDYEYGLLTADLACELLNSGVSAASIWCLHQIQLIDEIKDEGGKMMRIGLWGYKDKDWQPFSLFYLYRLLTRYIRSGSEVLENKITPAGILKAACIRYKDRYSLIIVNMTDSPQRFSVSGIESESGFKRYLYTRDNISGVSMQRDVHLSGEIAPETVVFFTNLDD